MVCQVLDVAVILIRQNITTLLILLAANCFGQAKKVVGSFNNGIALPAIVVTFHADSTFEYTSMEHPTFYRWEYFSEKGKWSVSGDTIILNPQLDIKPFVEYELQEQNASNDTAVTMTFNHIKRYFDANGNVIKADTLQIKQLDYAFNELKKKKLTRVAEHPTTRCAFAGYIPKEIITPHRRISVPRPAEKLRSIFIGCYELQGTKEMIIRNPDAGYFTLNIYSNYYQDGQMRQRKFLIKNENNLYTAQKANGAFVKDNIWGGTGPKLKRKKGGG